MADGVRGSDPGAAGGPGPQGVGQGSTPAPEIEITVRTVKVADVPERAVRAYAEHRERLAELLTPEALARFDEAERRLDEQVVGDPLAAVTERGVERMAIHLYVGWGMRAHGPAWASLDGDERASWKAAARSLLRVALEADRRG